MAKGRGCGPGHGGKDGEIILSFPFSDLVHFNKEAGGFRRRGPFKKEVAIL